MARMSKIAKQLKLALPSMPWLYTLWIGIYEVELHGWKGPQPHSVCGCLRQVFSWFDFNINLNLSFGVTCEAAQAPAFMVYSSLILCLS